MSVTRRDFVKGLVAGGSIVAAVVRDVLGRIPVVENPHSEPVEVGGLYSRRTGPRFSHLMVRIKCSCGEIFETPFAGINERLVMDFTDAHGSCVVPRDLALQVNDEIDRIDLEGRA